MRYTHTEDFEKVTLVRVSKKFRCSQCGHADWCNIASNGAFVLCMRVEKGSIKQAANGAYIHVLDKKILVPQLVPSIYSSNKADIHHIHRVYSYLIRNCLNLKSIHRKSLIEERGFSEEAIKYNYYMSCPISHKDYNNVLSEMEKKYGDKLKGVPGFFKQHDKWAMLRYAGIMLPSRDAAGRIRGFQIRKSFGKPKYVWFSTPPEAFIDGASSGAPLHFSHPQDTDKILITEGVLKADRVFEFTKIPTVGLPGVSSVNPKTVSNEIRKAFPNLKKVIIAYDADFKINKFVLQPLTKIGKELELKGYKVRIRTWDGTVAKGYDDLLMLDRKSEVLDYSLHDFEILTS